MPQPPSQAQAEQFIWPAFNVAFEQRLNEHIDQEEERARADAVRHALDEKRFDDGAKTMKQLADDLAPIKKMYYALLGCATLATAVLGMGAWVYTNDRADAKADRQDLKIITSAVSDQSTAIKVLLSRMQDFKEEKDRMRITLEKRK